MNDKKNAAVSLGNCWDWISSAYRFRGVDYDGLDVLNQKTMHSGLRDIWRWEIEVTWQKGHPRKTWWDYVKESMESSGLWPLLC